ncbi:MAG TPA: carboxypeptidase-like regulatory domain-containing protein, partial [Candidatus Acidoferrum sp.]|nr:carboxypeptidase-like regulatory domain-containing protein [Candidatus Acidoferrum sp.]
MAAAGMRSTFALFPVERDFLELILPLVLIYKSTGARKEQFMRFFISSRVSFVVAIILLTATSGFSQTGTTSLHGVITDKTGAAIAGAAVKLSNPAQGLERQTTSSVSGEYEFLVLSPGTYNLTAEKSNFRRYEQKNLQLLVNLPATVNVTLELGTAAEVVEVSAQTVTINTIDASI